MQNVAPTRRLNRRSRDALLLAAVLFLFGAGLIIAGIGLHVIALVVPSNRAFALFDLARKSMLALGAGLCPASMLLALRAITWRIDNAAAWELGELLAGELDRRFVYVRNISQRGIGYVDAALISGHGILLLRITRRRGELANDGGKWLRRGRKGQWRNMRWNPTREVISSAFRVKGALRAQGLGNAPVFAAVVFMRDSPQARLHLRQPAVPALHASGFVDGLSDSYFAESRLDAESVQRAVNLLYR